MHADKTSLYLNQVLNWNLLTAARIWYSRCFSIWMKRAPASKPCKKHTLSHSSLNNFPQNHPTTNFSSWLDQGDNWSSNWANIPPSAPGTSAGKLFYPGSVCSQQPTKTNYPKGYFRVILPHFPHCFYEEPTEMSSPWESFSSFKPKGALSLFLWWFNIHDSWGGYSGSHNKWEWVVWL